MTQPKRGYSWPPFEPGHQVSLKHGAWSPRVVDPLAEELVATVAATVDWWRPCDRPAIWAWARAEVRCQLLVEWLAGKGGDVNDDGTMRPAAEALTRLEATAGTLRARLGLDPLSRARLGRDVAGTQVDLARLWATEDRDATDDDRAAETATQVPETEE